MGCDREPELVWISALLSRARSGPQRSLATCRCTSSSKPRIGRWLSELSEGIGCRDRLRCLCEDSNCAIAAADIDLRIRGQGLFVYARGSPARNFPVTFLKASDVCPPGTPSGSSFIDRPGNLLSSFCNLVAATVFVFENCT